MLVFGGVAHFDRLRTLPFVELGLHQGELPVPEVSLHEVLVDVLRNLEDAGRLTVDEQLGGTDSRRRHPRGSHEIEGQRVAEEARTVAQHEAAQFDPGEFGAQGSPATSATPWLLRR